MTIRFLQPWGGYQIGDRVTLASATETSLKAAGLARDDYTQDGPVSGVPVTAILSDQGIAGFSGGPANYQPTRRRAVLLGDSITDMCDGLRVNGTYSAPWAKSYWVWANSALGWMFDYTVNAGVSGNRSDQAAARYDAEVDPLNFGLLVVPLGTNDVLQTTAINFDEKFATYKASILQIVAKAVARNALVCLCTVGPMGTGQTVTSEMIRQRARINQWLRQVAQRADGVVLADWDSALTDHTTAYRPIGDLDGKEAVLNDALVHPNGAGACIMGRCIAAALAPVVGSIGALIPRGITPNQAVTNQHFAGASGSTAPTAWTVNSLSSPSTTWSFGYESRSDDVNALQLTVALTASGVMPAAQLQHFVTYDQTIFPVGSKVRCALEVENVYSGAGVDAQIGLYFAATTPAVAILADTNIMHDASINSAGETRYVNSSAKLPAKMLLMTAALTIPAGSTGFLIKIRLGGAHGIRLKSCSVLPVLE